MSNNKDTLDEFDDSIEDIEHSDQDMIRYEKKYGRDTAEEEMMAILEDVSQESKELSDILSVSSNILDNVSSLSEMADSDRKPSLQILHRLANTTKFNTEVLNVSNESRDDFVYSEGLVASIINWASSAVVASFKIFGYALKRGSIFISRTRKDADQLDKRLTKLDPLMKSRKSENNKFYFDKAKLAMFVEEYDVNTNPAGSISTFAGSIYSIINKKMDMLRKISTKAEADLTSESEIDIKEYTKIVEDLVDDLVDTYKDKEVFIGNKYIKVHKENKLDKLITFEIDRPDPKSIIGKFRPLKALSNSEVESQRSSIRSGVLKKMYKMIDESSKDLKAISEFNKANSATKKDDDKSPDKKDAAELGKFLNNTIGPTIKSIMELSKYAYDLVDANVTLLEDSVSVTKILDEEELSTVEKNVGKKLGLSQVVD